jgi:hypothetical protein
LAPAVEVEETVKVSVQQVLNSTPAVMQNSEGVIDVSKRDESQIRTAGVRASAANVGTKKPCNFRQVGPDQHYEVKVFALPAGISKWRRLFNIKHTL